MTSGAVLKLDIAHIDRQHSPPYIALSTLVRDMKHMLAQFAAFSPEAYYYAGEKEGTISHVTIADDDL
jgi:hypothetical protein